VQEKKNSQAKKKRHVLRKRTLTRAVMLKKKDPVRGKNNCQWKKGDRERASKTGRKKATETPWSHSGPKDKRKIPIFFNDCEKAIVLKPGKPGMGVKPTQQQTGSQNRPQE